jgi:steroid delta-isomerase-like uncharacterized protein
MNSLIERYYHAFNAGDRDAMLAMLDEDVVHEINEGHAETGRAAFRAFLQRMDLCYEERVEELVIFGHESGARAAAEFYIRGKYVATDEGLPEATGQEYYLRVGAFFEIADGKITRVTNYYNLRTWLGLVGA